MSASLSVSRAVSVEDGTCGEDDGDDDDEEEDDEGDGDDPCRSGGLSVQKMEPSVQRLAYCSAPICQRSNIQSSLINTNTQIQILYYTQLPAEGHRGESSLMQSWHVGNSY